jgi:hypothetical protein
MRPAYITATSIGDIGDHAHVMGDQHDAGAALGDQLFHQVEDLRLDGHVQRRGRLVGDQDVGPADQRDGDHDALAHAAGQLERILGQAPVRIGNADIDTSICARLPAPRAGDLVGRR